MKLVVKVPNGFGKVVNDVSDQELCVPIKICVGRYIYRTHAYAMFDDKADVNLKDIDLLNDNSEKEDQLCKTCFHYPEECKISSNAICIMCTNPHNSIDHLYYKKKEDSNETIFESNNQR